MTLTSVNKHEQKSDNYFSNSLAPVGIKKHVHAAESKSDKVTDEGKRNLLQFPQKAVPPKKFTFKKLFSNKASISISREKPLSVSELDALVLKVTQIDGPGTYDDLKAIKDAKRKLISTRTHLKVKTLAESKIIQSQLDDLLRDLNAAKTKLCQNETVINGFIKARMADFRARVEVRISNVTTKEMYHILEKRLMGVRPHQIMDVSRMICRNINDVLEEPEKYAGHYLLLHKNTQKYPFFFQNSRGKQVLTLDFTYWLKVSENADHVELFIVPNTKEPLGTGANKTIHKAQYIDILFKGEIIKNHPKVVGVRPFIYKPMVLLKPTIDGCISDIESGMTLHSELAANLPESALTSLPIKLPFPSDVSDENPLTLYFQDWYNSDLRKVVMSREVPLDISEKPKMLKIKDKDIIKIFDDITKTLIGWHQYGIIHRDIKLSNILVEVLEDRKTVRGVLADYDVAQRPGKGFISDNPYEYWDTLSNQTVVTPFTDLYGLSMSLAEAFIPNLLNVKRKDILKYKAYFITEANKVSNLRRRIVEKILNYLETILKYDQQLEEAFPLQTRKDLVQAEINQYFCPYVDPEFQDLYLDEIIALIPNFRTFTPTQQASLLRLELEKALDVKGQDQKKRQMHLKWLLRTCQLINHKIMSNYLNDFQAKERERHPLYVARLNPEKIDKESIQDNINEEIDLLNFSKYNDLFKKIKGFEKFDTPLERRKALKEALKKVINNPFQKELKGDATKFLNKIYIIEDAMAYFVKVGEICNKEALLIAQKLDKSMQKNLPKFITLLDSLKEICPA